MAEFIDKVPDFAIEDGNLCARTGEVSCYMPLRVARMAHARLGRALAEHDARKAEVVELKGKRARH